MEQSRSVVNPLELESWYQEGLKYSRGGVSPEKQVEAAEWFRKAAEQGHAPSQHSLGWCYKYGYGVTEDRVEAIKWYRMAAEQGDPKGQNSLAYCHSTGEGVAQDDVESVKWYRKAAEQGYADAQWSLGLCYENGRGVQQDYFEAVRWYRKATEQGNSMARSRLFYCNKHGHGMTPDSVEADKRLLFGPVLPQIHGPLSVELRFGFDAGESALLCVFARQYYPERIINMIRDDVEDERGSMQSIMEIMMMATPHGGVIHIESDLTDVERQQFDEIMLLLFWIPLPNPKDASSVGYIYCDSIRPCGELIRKCKGDAAALLTALRVARQDPNSRPIFTEAR